MGAAPTIGKGEKMMGDDKRSILLICMGCGQLVEFSDEIAYCERCARLINMDETIAVKEMPKTWLGNLVIV
jgi:RNA polymerase subunit RPABC4/transcription elongation factor Spt4